MYAKHPAARFLICVVLILQKNNSEKCPKLFLFLIAHFSGIIMKLPIIYAKDTAASVSIYFEPVLSFAGSEIRKNSEKPKILFLTVRKQQMPFFVQFCCLKQHSIAENLAATWMI